MNAMKHRVGVFSVLFLGTALGACAPERWPRPPDPNTPRNTCLTPDDCLPGNVCNAEGICVRRCEGPQDCGGAACERGLCQPPSSSSAGASLSAAGSASGTSSASGSQ